MALNVFIKIPKRGDIVVGDKGAKKVRYIAEDTFNITDFNTNYSSFEIIGVVYRVHQNKVDILYKNNASKAYCNRLTWRMGAIGGKSITFGIKTSADWNTSVSIPIDLTSITTSSDIVAKLKSVFDTNDNFKAQNWLATLHEDGSTIIVTATWSDYRQYLNTCVVTGSSTSVWTHISMSEVSSHNSLRRMNGGVAGEGAISCWARARAYYKSSTSNQVYQGDVQSELTSMINRQYPINYSSYMGKNSTGKDYCSSLRAQFGSGEEGWETCNKTLLPVLPIGEGDGTEESDGLDITRRLYEYTYKDANGNTVHGCPAATYAYETSTTCIPQGNWYLPIVAELAYIVQDIEYPIDKKGNTTARNTGDILNKSLYKIGGSTLPNNSHYWSCHRYGVNTGWYSDGLGFFGLNSVNSSLLAVPVCSLELNV